MMDIDLPPSMMDHQQSMDKGDDQHPTPTMIRRSVSAQARSFVAGIDIPDDFALAATGSLSRGEMTPFSDIDIVIVHPASHPQAVNETLESIAYQLMDGPYRVDYSIRSPKQCEKIVSEDLTAGLSLLDLTCISGDHGLVADTRRRVLDAWRTLVLKDFAVVADTAISRWQRSGSVVTMTRPDLKNGRGGLRDIEFLHALSLANLIDQPDLAAQRRLLLDVRCLLHESLRRGRDILEPECAAEIASQLGFATRIRLGAALVSAARRVDAEMTSAMHVAREKSSRRALFSRSPRQPLAKDVVACGSKVSLARKADLSDPGLGIRVAACAVRHDLSVPMSVWNQLKNGPDIPLPWTRTIRESFLTVLGAGARIHDIVPQLVEVGVWQKLLPEWKAIDALVPREPNHIHTVDYHLLDTVARLETATMRVPRPDLLLVAGILHDIGKGTSRPHAQVGAEIAARVATRMGLVYADRARLQTLVAEHTILMRLVATAAPDDPHSVSAVLEACHWDPLTVSLLKELTIADAKATSDKVYSPRVATAMEILVGKVLAQLVPPLPVRPFVSVPGKLGVIHRDEGERIYMRETDMAGVIAAITTMSGTGLIIDSAQVTVTPPGSHEADADSVIRAVFDVYSKTGDSVDEKVFIQALKSGVHTHSCDELAPAPTAFYWYTTTLLEIRTTDRPAILAHLLEVVPPFSWLTATTPGAMVIARIQFVGPVSKSKVEKLLQNTGL